MPKAKNVTVIPATLNIHTKTPTAERVRRRVAAYARVSTDSEEQLTSYEVYSGKSGLGFRRGLHR